ncbi:MAG: hypothetical protein Q7S06_01590 [Nanoarchaeota archaeon]|nr:hypothetical protein [Nanoarchaeota archaeon]
MIARESLDNIRLLEAFLGHELNSDRYLHQRKRILPRDVETEPTIDELLHGSSNIAYYLMYEPKREKVKIIPCQDIAKEALQQFYNTLVQIGAKKQKD